MEKILEKLKKTKEALTDAMALEGLDVEEDVEEEKKLEKEEKGLKILSWFPTSDESGGGYKQRQGDSKEVESNSKNEPLAKKPKLAT